MEQLEILRILGEDINREWSSEEVGRKIQSTPEAAALHLAAMESRGLLTCIRTDGVIVCRYGPRSAELEPEVARLLELYRQRPVTMIRLVYERAQNALRNFSDAFNLRKEQ